MASFLTRSWSLVKKGAILLSGSLEKCMSTTTMTATREGDVLGVDQHSEGLLRLGREADVSRHEAGKQLLEQLQ